MNDKDKREGWLKELKVGDLVLIDYGFNKQSIGKIDKITPTGKISIGSSRYRPDGHIEGTGYYKSRIRLFTENEKLQIDNEKLLNGIERNIDFIKRSIDLNTKNKRLKSLDNEKLEEFHRYLQKWREKNDN